MNPFTKLIIGHEASRLSPTHRTTHMWVIGQPGTGKSRAIESWAMQDMEAGYGVAVIDPHGDVYNHLCLRIAQKPHLWPRVILLNPCDPIWTVCFNPLASIQGLPIERTTLFLTDVMVKLWKLDIGHTPRLLWLLTNTCLALADLGLTLLDLPRFLLDAPFRASLLPHVKEERVRTYFLWEFPQSPGAIQQWVTPVLNKIGALLVDRDIRLMLSSGPTINFREILDNKSILLVNVPKGVLGEGSSALLAAFIVAHLQKAALSRGTSLYREPFYLYLDEFQNYTTDNIQDILSESRKYALSLTLAHQYLDQLPQQLRSGVMNTAGILACFRVGYHDAIQLVKEIFPSPDFISVHKTEMKLRRFHFLPFPTITGHDEPLKWEGLAQRLVALSPREFWLRRRGEIRPVKVRTLDMPTPQLTPELLTRLEQLRNTSGTLYGKLKQEVEQEANRNSRYGAFLGNGRFVVPPFECRDEASNDIPLWSD